MALKEIITLIGTIITMSHAPDAKIENVSIKQPETGAYVVKIPTAKYLMIEPYVSNELKTTQEIYDSTTYKLVVNAGFFDPINAMTTSYVIKEGKMVLDPTTNDRLMLNPELKQHLPQILNRSEFRRIECDGATSFDIAYHEDALPENCKIVDSIQAGPMLLPSPTLEKEYFVVEKDGKIVRDSISALKKVARTAIGIKGNDVYLILATDKNPMTIAELSAFAKKLELDKAMAFDGGSSTSINMPGLCVTSLGDGKGRKVKSFLIVKW